MAKQIIDGQDSAKKPGAPQAPASAETTTKPAPEKAPVVVEIRQFRKLPVIIKAFQWFPELGEVAGVILKDSPEPGADRVYVVETLEGDMRVNSADWIITGVKGEVYPCKDEIFRMTYEEAKETEMPDPAKLPVSCPRNITWVIVRFSNGDAFKLPAKFIARRMVDVAKEKGLQVDYDKAMRSPAALVKFASEEIGWNELTMVAHGYQTPVQSDRPLEWATAYKTVEMEPEPKPERVTAPIAQGSEIKTAKQEDAEEAKKPRKDPDDPENWKDDE